MRLHKKKDPFLFLLFPMIAYLAVVLIPIIASIVYSFMNWNGITDMTFTGLGNYAKMFNDTTLRTVLINTLIYAAIATLLQVGVGMCLAILVQQVHKGQNLIRALLFMPVVISSMAMSQTFKKLLAISPDGVVNALLSLLGLSHLRTSFLADTDITLFVVAIVDSFRFWGLYMVVFYTALTAIDREVIEGSEIDGANKLQTLFYVKLPMIRGIIINCIVLVSIGTLKAFEGPYILTNGGPGYTSELMATYMYKTAFNNMDYGYGSALSILIVIVCLVIFGLINRLTRQKD